MEVVGWAGKCSDLTSEPQTEQLSQSRTPFMGLWEASRPPPPGGPCRASWTGGLLIGLWESSSDRGVTTPPTPAPTPPITPFGLIAFIHYLVRGAAA